MLTNSDTNIFVNHNCTIQETATCTEGCLDMWCCTHKELEEVLELCSLAALQQDRASQVQAMQLWCQLVSQKRPSGDVVNGHSFTCQLEATLTESTVCGVHTGCELRA